MSWENFKQNYKNFWQDLHNIKKYDSKICITFFLKSKKFFLAQVSKDFFFRISLHKFQRIFFLLAQVSKVFFKNFCLHKDFFLDVLLTYRISCKVSRAIFSNFSHLGATNYKGMFKIALENMQNYWKKCQFCLGATIFWGRLRIQELRYIIEFWNKTENALSL